MIKRAYISGNPIPDNVINSLIEARMKCTDVQMNGYVLEGFPMSESQINQMCTMGLKPKCIFMLSVSDDECMKRLGDRRVDPTTGEKYNLQMIRLADGNMAKTLHDALLDGEKTGEQIQELGLGRVAHATLQVLARDMTDAKPVTVDILSRLTSQQEDNM